MLAIRSCCEHCAKLLAADSDQAFMCSFECTFCQQCVALLENVCPNCGGGFERRPIRPKQNLKNGNCLSYHPAQQNSIHNPVALKQHSLFVDGIATAASER